jgi:alkylhydroperoxidase family enzyme
MHETNENPIGQGIPPGRRKRPLPGVDPSNTPEGAGPILESIQKNMGAIPTIYRIMAHAPAVLEASQKTSRALNHGLSARLKEIAYIRASAINLCEY